MDGIAEDDGVGRTCQRSISDWYLTGLYKVLKAMNNSLNVTLELPQEFKDRRINPTFHTNLV